MLEHIKEDGAALSEVRRVLKKGGIAVLPVPVIAEKTVEYPEANPLESGHVRAPGRDYYDRYKNYFSRVEIYSSDDFPGEHRIYIYEKRDFYPTEDMPLRPSMPGEKHADLVPVCFA